MQIHLKKICLKSKSRLKDLSCHFWTEPLRGCHSEELTKQLFMQIQFLFANSDMSKVTFRQTWHIHMHKQKILNIPKNVHLQSFRQTTSNRVKCHTVLRLVG
jgi:hypothetical protein